ncbi:MAG: RsmB/NOP family class I SAM-dependent RNA methyltransferase [SAR324 cluster bacterium]|nr:RsmB/NOP family class I SAM-dependent RNA methyltransferase [SAR324 cluster bacterium]
MQKTQNKKNVNPREAAALDLLDWYRNGSIIYRRRQDLITQQNYALYRNLVSSIIRHKEKYLYFIKILTGRSLKKLDREVVICLLLGLVQLDQLSGIQDYAAVNESVELISFFKKPHLKGFINGNLRSFLRRKGELELGLEQQPLFVRTSHSEWMVERWKNQYGLAATEKICDANNRQPEVRVVLNPAFDREKIEDDLAEQYDIVGQHPEGFTLNNPAGLFDTKWADAGAFLVQDHSSQQINRLIDPLPKTCVLDACAAPGGKLFHMEWQFGEDIDQLVALEISEQRLHRLKINKYRFKSRVLLVRMDAACPGLTTGFDLILVDAPCSSTGTIQKHPELKWQRSESDILQNQQKQLLILNGLDKIVKVTGHILYVTCSLEKEENQDVIMKFLDKQARTFRHIPFSTEQVDEECLSPEGFYQCFPQKSAMGLFAALLQKTAEK